MTKRLEPSVDVLARESVGCRTSLPGMMEKMDMSIDKRGMVEMRPKIAPSKDVVGNSSLANAVSEAKR